MYQTNKIPMNLREGRRNGRVFLLSAHTHNVACASLLVEFYGVSLLY